MDPQLVAQITAVDPQLFAIFHRESSRSDKAKSLINLLVMVGSLLTFLFLYNDWIFCVMAAIGIMSFVSSLVFCVLDKFGLVDRERWLQTPRSRARNKVRVQTLSVWLTTAGCILLPILAAHHFYKLYRLSEERWVYDAVFCVYAFGFCITMTSAALTRLARFSSKRELYRIVMVEDRNLVNDKDYFVA